MNIIENETPKYIKKKQSSTSKSSEKTKHKHEYTEKCIVKYPTRHLLAFNIEYRFAIATYCKYCGKIENIWHPEIEDNFNRGLIHNAKRYMSDEEILEVYKDLDVVEISDLFQKYLPISKGDD